ncbi:MULTISPECIES: mechanosensitive ion channel family protein [Neisseria]|uniref:Small-conductance mechanosensitive channel n=1 Tax=Neisseria musculi TaxID=1815583 RepID=A0A7H1MES5_9NEIS|nr:MULTISPECIES: mechanosensitive ion channel family protein [Neisseria]QNT60140.1 mechanosensitive ion channel family protein [Neisseria musculi]
MNTVNRINNGIRQSLGHYEAMTESVQAMIEAFWLRVPYLAVALLAFVLFWLLARLFKILAAKLLSRRLSHRANLMLVLQRIGSALIVFGGFLVAMMIAIPDFTPAQLVSTLGIGSVAIGFAFKDIFQNLLSGILLLLNEPFKIGDRIVSGSFEGEVENIEIRATTLRTDDDRRIVIPNSQLFTSPVTVNTRAGLYRQSTMLTLPAGLDAGTVKEQIIHALQQQCGDIVSQPEIAVTALSDTTATLELRWWAQGHADNNMILDRVLSCVQPLLTQGGKPNGDESGG